MLKVFWSFADKSQVSDALKLFFKFQNKKVDDTDIVDWCMAISQWGYTTELVCTVLSKLNAMDIKIKLSEIKFHCQEELNKVLMEEKKKSDEFVEESPGEKERFKRKMDELRQIWGKDAYFHFNDDEVDAIE